MLAPVGVAIGRNHLAVDDVSPDDATTFNKAADPLFIGPILLADEYVMGNITESDISVDSVLLTYRVRTSSAGIVKRIRAGFLIGGTPYMEAWKATGNAWATYATPYALDPSTSLAWTTGGVDGAKVKVEAEVQSASGQLAQADVTQVHLTTTTTSLEGPGFPHTKVHAPITADGTRLMGHLADSRSHVGITLDKTQAASHLVDSRVHCATTLDKTRIELEGE